MKNRGQSVLEIAVLTMVIVAALIATTYYLKRGFQGRYRDLADSMGEQYDPKKTDSKRISKTTTESVSVSGREGKAEWSSTEWELPFGWGGVTFRTPWYVLKSSESSQTFTNVNTVSEDHYHVAPE